MILPGVIKMISKKFMGIISVLILIVAMVAGYVYFTRGSEEIKPMEISPSNWDGNGILLNTGSKIYLLGTSDKGENTTLHIVSISSSGDISFGNTNEIQTLSGHPVYFSKVKLENKFYVAIAMNNDTGSNTAVTEIIELSEGGKILVVHWLRNVLVYSISENDGKFYMMGLNGSTATLLMTTDFRSYVVIKSIENVKFIMGSYFMQYGANFYLTYLLSLKNNINDDLSLIRISGNSTECIFHSKPHTPIIYSYASQGKVYLYVPMKNGIELYIISPDGKNIGERVVALPFYHSSSGITFGVGPERTLMYSKDGVHFTGFYKLDGVQIDYLQPTSTIINEKLYIVALVNESPEILEFDLSSKL